MSKDWRDAGRIGPTSRVCVQDRSLRVELATGVVIRSRVIVVASGAPTTQYGKHRHVRGRGSLPLDLAGGGERLVHRGNIDARQRLSPQPDMGLRIGPIANQDAAPA